MASPKSSKTVAESPRSRTPKDHQFKPHHQEDLQKIWAQLEKAKASLSAELKITLDGQDFPMSRLLRKVFVTRSKLAEHEVPKAANLLRMCSTPAAAAAAASPLEDQSHAKRLDFEGFAELNWLGDMRQIRPVERAILDWASEPQSSDTLSDTMSPALAGWALALQERRAVVKLGDTGARVMLQWCDGDGSAHGLKEALIETPAGDVAWRLSWASPARSGPVFQQIGPDGRMLCIPLATAPSGFLAGASAWGVVPPAGLHQPVKYIMRSQLRCPAPTVQSARDLVNVEISLVSWRFGDFAAECAVRSLSACRQLPPDAEAFHFSVRIKFPNPSESFETHWSPTRGGSGLFLRQ